VKVLWPAWVVISAAIVSTYGQTPGPVSAEINPPLGLYWGEPQQQLEAQRVPVVERAVVQQRDAWTVEGFTEQGLRRAILYFGPEKTLVEVELQYQEPTWTFDDYRAFFASARTNFQEKYGQPVILARYKEPLADVVETLVCLLWRATGSSVRLCYYSAERGVDAWRVVSLHYRCGPMDGPTLQASK
jgi:hypothetical protein